MMDRVVERSHWPDAFGMKPSGVAVVTVNHNTAELVALLLWSLYRVLQTNEIGEVVVVDNGSSDGSVELLAGLAEEGLCHVLANEENRQHGPGLNQGLSHLSNRARSTGEVPSWVWILDSDCVVARADALHSALNAADDTGASVLGESQSDPWHGVDRFGTHCLMMNPAQTWREPIATFEAGGDPSFGFLSSCQAEGLVLTEFGFQRDGHVIHRGRGTLARLVASDARSNPLFEWALEHHEAHFGGISGAEERYATLTSRFLNDVPRLDATSLAAPAPSADGSRCDLPGPHREVRRPASRRGSALVRLRRPGGVPCVVEAPDPSPL
jgi:hypothetical protein